MPTITELRANLSAANTAVTKLAAANAILALRVAPQPAPAKRIIKKAAMEAYDNLSFAIDSLSGAMDAELMRQDVPAYLGPRMQVLRDMVAAGWPMGTVTPDGVLERAQAAIDRWTRLKSEGLKADMGRGEAWGYLVHDKGLTAEQAEVILATPSSVKTSPGFLGKPDFSIPSYTMDYLNAEADKALQPPLAVEKIDPPVPVDPASLVTPPVEISAEDVARSADATFLQSMISGAVNLLDETLITKLEPMFEQYASDDAMMDLLGQAAEAYSAAAMKAAKAAMK